MSDSQKTHHTHFHFGFVLASLLVALTVGFGYAAILAVLIGFQISMGNWWVAMLQAHGHAQLLGWIGLFIIGVSLYFLPRLAGTPLRFPRLPTWILCLLATGILLRAVSQPLLAAGIEDPFHSGLRWALGFSALLETTGVYCYIALLVITLRSAAPNRPAPADGAHLPGNCDCRVGIVFTARGRARVLRELRRQPASAHRMEQIRH